jgi:hypothetical protein
MEYSKEINVLIVFGLFHVFVSRLEIFGFKVAESPSALEPHTYYSLISACILTSVCRMSWVPATMA